MFYLLFTDAHSDGGWYYGPAALTRQEQQELLDDCKTYNLQGEKIALGLADLSSYVDQDTKDACQNHGDGCKHHVPLSGIVCSRCVTIDLPASLIDTEEEEENDGEEYIISPDYSLVTEAEMEKILTTPFSFGELPTLGFRMLPATRRLFQKPLLPQDQADE